MAAVKTTIYSSRFNVATWLSGSACLVTRSPEAFETQAEIDDDYTRLVEALEAASVDALLLDLRAARGRNDAAFESGLAVHRRRLLGLASRSVVLVQSAIGQLQVKRHLVSDGMPHVDVLRDEYEARGVILGTSRPPARLR